MFRNKNEIKNKQTKLRFYEKMKKKIYNLFDVHYQSVTRCCVMQSQATEFMNEIWTRKKKLIDVIEYLFRINLFFHSLFDMFGIRYVTIFIHESNRPSLYV